MFQRVLSIYKEFLFQFQGFLFPIPGIISLQHTDYKRIKDKSIVKRRLKPVAIMFSEYYFYLTAFIDDPKVRADFDEKDDPFPTIYRID